MPKLADTLVEGTVARWLKAVGDTVSAGEPLVEIETDKVSTELVAPAGGVLTELVVPEGETVPVDAVIARIGGERAAEVEEAPERPPESASSQPASSPHPQPSPSEMGPGLRAADTPESKPKATSVAACLLAEHGLSVEQVAQPSARRVTKQDVLRYVESTRPPPATHSTLQPASTMRRAIAEHMARARATIPHGQTVMAADVSRLVAWREGEKADFEAREGARLTFTVFFVAALGRALGRLGADSGAARPGRDGGVDVGVAVALDGGLIVPVVREADRRSLGEIARAVDDLAGRARAGKLAPDETVGAAMTVTNAGSFGNLAAFPIVPLRQVGILAPGIVERRPLPAPDGGIRLGWRCLLTLVFDRRELSDLAADRLLRATVDELERLAWTPVLGAQAAG